MVVFHIRQDEVVAKNYYCGQCTRNWHCSEVLDPSLDGFRFQKWGNGELCFFPERSRVVGQQNIKRFELPLLVQKQQYKALFLLENAELAVWKDTVILTTIICGSSKTLAQYVPISRPEIKRMNASIAKIEIFLKYNKNWKFFCRKIINRQVHWHWAITN